MDSKTREKLKQWVIEVEKLDDETKKREAEVWCTTAMNILLEDKDFLDYIKKDKLQ